LQLNSAAAGNLLAARTKDRESAPGKLHELLECRFGSLKAGQERHAKFVKKRRSKKAEQEQQQQAKWLSEYERQLDGRNACNSCFY
jgi:hypothetical protein